MEKSKFTHCSFAFPGTFGHECGSPATKVGIQESTVTKNGVFYARRCNVCATYKGGENAGTQKWVKYNPEIHVNQF